MTEQDLAAIVFILGLVTVMLIVPWLVAPAWLDRRTPEKRAVAQGLVGQGPVGQGGFFTSNRERRLWLWAMVVVVAIYASLGPAQRLAAALRERNLLRISIAAVLLLVGAPVVWRWVKSRPGWREIGIALGVTAVYLMAWFRVTSLEERSHLFEYGLVATLIHQALIERWRHRRRLLLPAVLAVALTALVGWIDEGIQAILPNRVYDIQDVGFNGLAGLMAVSASLALAWARRWRSRTRAHKA